MSTSNHSAQDRMSRSLVRLLSTSRPASLHGRHLSHVIVGNPVTIKQMTAPPGGRSQGRHGGARHHDRCCGALEVAAGVPVTDVAGHRARRRSELRPMPGRGFRRRKPVIARTGQASAYQRAGRSPWQPLGREPLLSVQRRNGTVSRLVPGYSVPLHDAGRQNADLLSPANGIAPVVDT